MESVNINYKAAYEDLSARIDRISRESSRLCRMNRQTDPLAQVFDELYGLGSVVLTKHIE